MVLVQEGFKCEFEMNIFINIFFKREEDVRIYTALNRDENAVFARARIEFENKEYTAEYTGGLHSGELSEKEKKKLFSCACTKAFCAAAQKIRDIPLPWGVMSGIRPAKSVRKYREEGKSDAEIHNLLKDIYNVSDEKIELAMEVSENEEEILKKRGENSVSIYIGIPFCPSRCLYCSFVSTDIRYSGKYMDEFFERLLSEIEKTRDMLLRLGLTVENVYIGGGTPTTLSENQLARLFDSINKNLVTKPLNEFTLEAGRPDTITREKLLAAKRGGISRISINPQTLNNETLEKIGRRHSAEDFFKCFYEARDVGFFNINTDLIAGLPGEVPEMFYKSVDGVLSLAPENITIHSMCIKRAASLRFSGVELSSYEHMNDMLSYAARRMREHDMAAYYMYRQKNISGNLENVGYAKRGYMSFYNINIMEEAQTIIALGGGGASKLVVGNDIRRVFNFKDPLEYIRRFGEILEKKDETERILKGGEA